MKITYEDALKFLDKEVEITEDFYNKRKCKINKIGIYVKGGQNELKSYSFNVDCAAKKSETGIVVFFGYGLGMQNAFANILDIRVVEQDIKVVLNQSHTAIVSKENVKVGCQEFTFNAIEQLYSAVQKQKTLD